MSVEHSCFLTLAKASMEQPGEEWVRNAVSRAYYSMYHSVLRLVEGHIPTYDKNGQKLLGGLHVRFSDYLCDGDAADDYSLDPLEVKKLGLKLKKNHYQRVNSDYKLTLQVNKIIAITSIREAEEVDLIVDKLIAEKR